MIENDLIKGRDIIVVGLQPWDVEIGSNCKDVAVEFSKHNRVLYVNYPLDRKTLFNNKHDPKIQKRLNVIKGKEKGLLLLQKNLWNLYPNEMAESINWINSYKVFDFLNKINNKRFARSINKAVAELGYKNIILFNDNDIMRSFYLKELLQPRVSIYYYRDYILGVDYWRKHGKFLEPLLVAKSDVVCTNSIYFRNQCLKYNKQTYYVGQGCDLSMFKTSSGFKTPSDIEKIPGVKIGYVGALQNIRLDIEVIAYIAEQRPAWSIILVGPEDDVFKSSRLHQVKNIYFTGSKDISDLASYINAFDITLNPQVINEITIGNYPRKIDEYLAMGKPVVATKTELMEAVFSEFTYLASSKEDYVNLIERAIKEDTLFLQQGRKDFAQTHSWETHVKEIYKAVYLFQSKYKTCHLHQK